MDLAKTEIAQAVYANVRQIVAQFNQKRKQTQENSWRIFFKPFPKLNDKILEEKLKMVDVASKKQDYQTVVNK